MKKMILSGIAILVSIVAFGQTVDVNGTVNDSKGKPVAFAFISDSQHPYGTFSDGNGSFYLKADPSSMLAISALGHTTSKIKVEANPKVVLADDPNGSAPATGSETKNIFANDDASKAAGGSFTGIGTAPDGTHGSRFLFGNWVHGFAVSPKGSIKQDDAYLFNYDKLDGNLIFTRDKTSLHQSVKDEVAAFTLFDENAQPTAFELVPTIGDGKHYAQVIATGSKYTIYKDLGTKFTKANFTTNGVTSSGNNYDEYSDESVYYVIKLPGGAPQKMALKKKAIKAVFTADADKVNKFLTDNDGDIDEAYIKKLGDYLNQ